MGREKGRGDIGRGGGERRVRRGGRQGIEKGGKYSEEK